MPPINCQSARGILAPKVEALIVSMLKRASFTSIQDLQQRILDFIDFFNKTMAKPFKWTYTGRPLNL